MLGFCNIIGFKLIRNRDTKIKWKGVTFCYITEFCLIFTRFFFRFFPRRRQASIKIFSNFFFSIPIDFHRPIFSFTVSRSIIEIKNAIYTEYCLGKCKVHFRGIYLMSQIDKDLVLFCVRQASRLCSFCKRTH